MFRRPKKRKIEIDPDEVFMDSSNLPAFDKQQFEGTIERPISKETITILLLFFVVLILFFSGRALQLQILEGSVYSRWSEDNSLSNTPILSERGVIYDRNNTPLAWNTEARTYQQSGFAHVLGYIGLPTEEDLQTGEYLTEEYIGKTGIEFMLDDILRGQTGVQIEETDVLGNIKSNYLLQEPINGESVNLSIDADIQQVLFNSIKNLAQDRGFGGGSGVIMDINTGEIISMTSYPEYDPNILSAGEDREAISNFLNDKTNPFLNRAVSGLYTPGSIVKPFMASAVLNENIISPDKTIISTGSISVPNPFFPDKPSIFRDWKAHGAVTIRDALAVSSNVYFYTVGGGHNGQEGLGIDRINKYMEIFGFGQPTGFLDGEPTGTIPNPKWKEEAFNGEPWRIGDTYYTSIGQYGFQVTPLQVVRGISAIANGGYLPTPSIILNEGEEILREKIKVDGRDLAIVREGMRQGVQRGTSQGLSIPGVAVAAKTGTAELGVSKSRVNSWVTGFFPYEKPQYAFVIVMESGPVKNLVGGTFVMRQVLDWIVNNAPEYTEKE